MTGFDVIVSDQRRNIRTDQVYGRLKLVNVTALLMIITEPTLQIKKWLFASNSTP
jgi:hypothetical protein